MPTRQKPGVAFRATFAFFLLNLPLILTVVATYYLAGGAGAEWWVRGIVAIMVAVGEFWIVVETIGPPIRVWIKSEEEVRPKLGTREVEYMVGRFLGWSLPPGFNPDGGIVFQKTYKSIDGADILYKPSGTNLLDYRQAEAMVRHMIDGIDKP